MLFSVDPHLFNVISLQRGGGCVGSPCQVWVQVKQSTLQTATQQIAEVYNFHQKDPCEHFYMILEEIVLPPLQEKVFDIKILFKGEGKIRKEKQRKHH